MRWREKLRVWECKIPLFQWGFFETLRVHASSLNACAKKTRWLQHQKEPNAEKIASPRGQSFFGKSTPGVYTPMLAHESHACLPVCTHSTAKHSWKPPGEEKTLQHCPSRREKEDFIMPKANLTAWVRLQQAVDFPPSSSHD